MSKNSPKQAVIQLKAWLETRKTSNPNIKEGKKFSKSEHYKKTRERYGYKKSN